MTPLEDMGQFATVVVDPPWDIQMGPVLPDSQWGITAPNLPYERLSISDITDLPIADCLAENALVFCWTVNQFLLHTFSIVSAWGCSYWFTMTWREK